MIDESVQDIDRRLTHDPVIQCLTQTDMIYQDTMHAFMCIFLQDRVDATFEILVN